MSSTCTGRLSTQTGNEMEEVRFTNQTYHYEIWTALTLMDVEGNHAQCRFRMLILKFVVVCSLRIWNQAASALSRLKTKWFDNTAIKDKILVLMELPWNLRTRKRVTSVKKRKRHIVSLKDARTEDYGGTWHLKSYFKRKNGNGTNDKNCIISSIGHVAGGKWTMQRSS